MAICFKKHTVRQICGNPCIGFHFDPLRFEEVSGLGRFGFEQRPRVTEPKQPEWVLSGALIQVVLYCYKKDVYGGLGSISRRLLARGWVGARITNRKSTNGIIQSKVKRFAFKNCGKGKYEETRSRN
jgi:hypothetical protein